ncbi:MAG TPA: hypothetical protein VGH33_23325 [Isosphaeraceae bacterium]
MNDAGRRPIAWSRESIALRSGSRCPAVHGATAVVTMTIGSSPPISPCSIARFQPWTSGRTTTAVAFRPR